MPQFEMFEAKEPWVCEGECHHKDCAANRVFVETPCPLCEQKVEPGRLYCFLQEYGAHVPVHSICADNYFAMKIDKDQHEAMES